MSVVPDPDAEGTGPASAPSGPPAGGATIPRATAGARTRIARFGVPSVIAFGGGVASYASIGEGFAGRPSLSQAVAAAATACVTFLGAAAVADRGPAEPGRGGAPGAPHEVPPEQRAVALCHLPGSRTWADWTATVLARAGFTVLRRGGPPPQDDDPEHDAERLLEGVGCVLVLIPEVPPQDLARWTRWLHGLSAAQQAGEPIDWIRYGPLGLWPDRQGKPRWTPSPTRPASTCPRRNRRWRRPRWCRACAGAACGRTMP